MPNDNTTAIRIAFVGSLTDVNDPVAKAIKNLIIMCDDDFIPPLSSRGSTKGAIATMDMHVKDYEPYFKIVLGQKNIVAYCEDKIVAFMSFRHNEPHDNIESVAKDGDIVNYVTTICVDKEYRGCRIATSFYEFIENKNNDFPKEVFGECVATRTWHTNLPHIKLLCKRGYSLTHTLPKDRRVNNTKSEELDTVYYCKRLILAD